jgi:hypothetical protein
MHDFQILGTNTPYVLATKKNEGIATFPGMPDIYHKDFDINEFIGEELASIRGVRSAHYFPVLFESMEKCLERRNFFEKCFSIRVGSFDFKEPGVKYITGPNLSFYDDFGTFDDLLDMCKDDKNREELIDELLEVYGLDIFCSQSDRPNNLYYEFHPNGEVHISKLFDYEYSFDDVFGDFYVADFHIFRKIEDYQKFIIKYPKLEEILRSYLDVDLESVIKKMARFRKFDLSRFDMDKYKLFDESTHKKLEKILR